VVTAATWLAGCADAGSTARLPTGEGALRQALLGDWYKPQTFVSGEKRPQQQPAITYRADGSCTYYLAAGSDQQPGNPSPWNKAWPGHWHLEGTKLHRTWEENWQYFRGGPDNGEILALTSQEMTLRKDSSGVIEHYYRHPRWDEREPVTLHPVEKGPWD
jgi:hypothetical protein